MGASRSVLLEPAPPRPLRRTPNGGALLRTGTIRGAPSRRPRRKAKRAPQPPHRTAAGCYEKKVPPLEKWRSGDPFRAEIEAATRQRALQLTRPPPSSPPKFYFGQDQRRPLESRMTTRLASSSGRSTSGDDWTPRQDISDDSSDDEGEPGSRWHAAPMPVFSRSGRTGGGDWGGSVPLFRGDANWTLGGGGRILSTAPSFYSTEDRRQYRGREEEEAAVVLRLARRVEEEVRRRRKAALQLQLRRLEEEDEAYFTEDAATHLSRWHSSPALTSGGGADEEVVYRRIMEVVREEEERQRRKSGASTSTSCSPPPPPFARRTKRPPPPPPHRLV